MRKLALILMLVLLPLGGQAYAQGAGTPAPREGPFPMQAQEKKVDGYRMLAVAAGAVGGAIVTNMLVGGILAPVVMGGGMAGMQGVAGAFMVARGALVVVGGIAGGYIGNSLYGK